MISWLSRSVPTAFGHHTQNRSWNLVSPWNASFSRRICFAGFSSTYVSWDSKNLLYPLLINISLLAPCAQVSLSLFGPILWLGITGSCRNKWHCTLPSNIPSINFQFHKPTLHHLNQVITILNLYSNHNGHHLKTKNSPNLKAVLAASSVPQRVMICARLIMSS